MTKLLLLALCFFAGTTFAQKGQPRLPEGTLPLYVPDPVLPENEGEPIGFACFGGCGPSCDCTGRIDWETTTKENGMICTWNLISCNTHSFCRWHDDCYRKCDFQFPGQVGDGSVGRSFCYRSCDKSCVTGGEPKPIGGWRPASRSPGQPPEALGTIACVKRLASTSGVPYDGVLTYAQLLQCVPDTKIRQNN